MQLLASFQRIKGEEIATELAFDPGTASQPLRVVCLERTKIWFDQK